MTFILTHRGELSIEEGGSFRAPIISTFSINYLPKKIMNYIKK